MLANNETGAIQPVAEIADIVHAAGGLLHVDAIQAFGKISLDIKSMQADLITLSAHKIGGPKGVGALVMAEEVQGLEPLLRGGGQELGTPRGNRKCRRDRSLRGRGPGCLGGLAGRRGTAAGSPEAP